MTLSLRLTLTRVSTLESEEAVDLPTRFTNDDVLLALQHKDKRIRKTNPKKILPPFQIISHSNNFVESKFFKFDQIYMKR